MLKPENINSNTIGFSLNIYSITNKFELTAHPKQPYWMKKTLNDTLKLFGIQQELKSSNIKIR